jgi:hypothetical protein
LKFLKILILRIKSIKTSPKIKNTKKKEGIELMSVIGDSVGLNVSIKGHRLLGLIKARQSPIRVGIIIGSLLGAKLGTTEEM